MVGPIQILDELACITDANITLLYDAQGTLKPMQDWPDEMRPAVRSVQVRVHLTADGAVEEMWDVRLWDKQRALKLLGTHLGLFRAEGAGRPRRGHCADLARGAGAGGAGAAAGEVGP